MFLPVFYLGHLFKSMRMIGIFQGQGTDLSIAQGQGRINAETAGAVFSPFPKCLDPPCNRKVISRPGLSGIDGQRFLGEVQRLAYSFQKGLAQGFNLFGAQTSQSH